MIREDECVECLVASWASEMHRAAKNNPQLDINMTGVTWHARTLLVPANKSRTQFEHYICS